MDEILWENTLKIFGAFLMVFLLVIIACIVFNVVGTYKLFKKCGKEGWEALIPIYSTWVLVVDVAKLHWVWFIVSCLSVVVSGRGNSASVLFLSLIVGIGAILSNALVAYNLSKKFHKSDGWFIASIFFGAIMIPLLGYSSKEVYDSSVVTNEHGFFKNN